MTEPLSPDQRRRVLAAEFALGLLDEDERGAALRLIEEDEAFAAEVGFWERKIDSWIGEQPNDIAPPPQLWNRIAASTGHGIAEAGAAPHSAGVSSAWRIMALAASAVAIVFGYLWLNAYRQSAAPMRVQTVAAPLNHLSVAQVQSAGDERLLAVVYDRQTGRLLARLAPLDARGGVPVLWLIGTDGKPRSLGSSHSDGELRLTLSPANRRLFADGATIAISLEPSAETAHDAPKGPILGSAKISAI